MRRRLVFLDALRGGAALVVVAQHAGERLWPGVRHWTATWLQLGQLGVMVFFLVSGFVVPISLQHGATVRDFWTSRLFRLWPAYWTSLVAVWLVHLAGTYPLPARVTERPLTGWGAQVTMAQAYLRVPDVQGVYWTLAFELAFYVLVSALAGARLLRHSVALAWGACATALALALLARGAGHHVPIGVATLATMFVGTVLWRWHTGDVTGRTATATFGVGLLTAQAVLAVGLADRGVDSSTPDAASWRAFASAWLLAYLVVGAALLARGRTWPPLLVWLGTVSYSVYLFHPVAINALHDPGLPRPLTALLWVAATLALAAVVHRLVERPAIGLGRRLRPHPVDAAAGRGHSGVAP